MRQHSIRFEVLLVILKYLEDTPSRSRTQIVCASRTTPSKAREIFADAVAAEYIEPSVIEPGHYTISGAGKEVLAVANRLYSQLGWVLKGDEKR
ncbi:hypothetical protein KKH23_06495 [Patescibacteria group bacterium]|uniref:Transcriptional regulator n=1 Tax=viral metagenome TaxID=1070528 RepID=A0A6M3MBX7_9ZZZZ|nr:hypothetical protein [Patescibacteria group bacterium]